MRREEIPPSLRRAVVLRAENRCEYCRLAQSGQEATFHVDHVVPLSAGGPTAFENLALACVSCSLRKGARQRALDPESASVVGLFDPRHDEWVDHFAWTNVEVLSGLTATGRATIAALNMNRPLLCAIRRTEASIGRHPPD